MNDLGPNTRALLNQARHGDHEDDNDMLASRERVRGALGRKLGVAAIGIAATTASTAGAGTTASIGVGLFGKALIGLAALGITAGGIAVSRNEAKPKPIVPTVVIAPPQLVIAPPQLALPIVPSAPNPQPLPPPALEPAPAPALAPALAPAPAPAPAPTPALAPALAPAPSLSTELTALRNANDAIAAGRPSEALVILDTSPASPTLLEERTALRLLATCALGHAGAADSARAFLLSHPTSPLAARLRSTCSVP